MPEHEALLTDDERAAVVGIAFVQIGTNKMLLLAQHTKTLAWADARKVKCPCRWRNHSQTWFDAGQAWVNCSLCHGSGEVTVGDLVKEMP